MLSRGACWTLLVLYQTRLPGHEGTCLADAREDLLGNPVLEGAGLRCMGAHSQLVEAGLRYQHHLAASTQPYFHRMALE